MKSDIKSIRVVYKYGAYGDSRKMGIWFYGKRPDGRTVPCRSKSTEDGGVKICSLGCETEFSAREWAAIMQANAALQPMICNDILMKRKNQG